MSEERQVVLAVWKRPRQYSKGHELVVEVLQRDPKHDPPIGITSCWEDKIQRENLRMILYVNDGQYDCDDYHVYRQGPEYRKVHSIDGGAARRMAEFFKRYERNLTKDQSSEHGDVLETLARTVGATEVCFPRGCGDDIYRSHALDGTWGNTKWVWYGVKDGRNHFRSLVTELVEMEKMRRGVLPVAA